ncbi:MULTISPECIES: phage tail protein [unclassified Streptomyces]|uniref:Phage tail protein n=1 Tax=Streptomyces sp. NBC_00180 TaxID=2903632 RepID=A0AAU1I8V7_9ACTN|nr:phage tail protein [Streptomyces sp. NBC_01017]WSV34850.1 phage tail protein [Streptomyces sp. NBC_01017]
MGNLDQLALANRFKVVLEDNTVDLGYWSSASGLDVSWNLCEYRAGDSGNRRTYFPGSTKYSDIVLQRAACQDTMKVQDWLKNCSFANSRKRFTGTIELGDSENLKIASWDLVNVMPLKWAVEKFEASASKVAMETLTLVHEGFLSDETQFQ